MKEENTGECVCGCELNEVFLDRSQNMDQRKKKKFLSQTPQTKASVLKRHN